MFDFFVPCLLACAAVYICVIGVELHYSAEAARAAKAQAAAICEILEILRGRAGEKDG